jgi:acyl dehydratase
MTGALVPPPLVVGPLTMTDIVRYQGASGDFYAIHHDEAFAKNAGFASPIALGMMQAGMLATWATDWLGAEQIRRFRVRFVEQVWPGDVLSCSGAVEREYEEAGEWRVDVELVCHRQTGGVAVLGWATFVTERNEESS